MTHPVTVMIGQVPVQFPPGMEQLQTEPILTEVPQVQDDPGKILLVELNIPVSNELAVAVKNGTHGIAVLTRVVQLFPGVVLPDCQNPESN